MIPLGGMVSVPREPDGAGRPETSTVPLEAFDSNHVFLHVSVRLTPWFLINTLRPTTVSQSLRSWIFPSPAPLGAFKLSTKYATFVPLNSQPLINECQPA